MSSLPPPPPPGGFATPPPPPPPPPPAPAAPYGYEAWTSQTNDRAGFWRRFFGLLLDGVLYGLALVAALIPAGVLAALALEDCTSIDGQITCPDGAIRFNYLVPAIALGVVAALGLFFIYVRSLGRRGTTWGRTIVGIRVVDISTHEPIGIPRALGRTLCENIISANILYLGHLWMLWDKNRQTWHDKITNSTVVRT
jgi:uncharacterized RDD family membrane protein YckC